MAKTYMARAYTHDDPFKWKQILDEVCKHRPWFSDDLWKDPDVRRSSASWYLTDARFNGQLFEVHAVDGEVIELVGVMLLNRVNYGIDGVCHFIFFDGELQSKRQLCLNMMHWAFDNLELEVLRVEVPTYAHKLASWARRKLGFRYEAEGRPLKWPAGKRPLTRKQAELGSRKHKGTRYKGQWVDVLLLSITKEEFYKDGLQTLTETRCEHGTVSGAVESSTGLSGGVS